MPNLHFDITGDCSGAESALQNTESAIDHLSGKTADVSVGVRGAGPAISQLGQVAAAATAASGAVSVSADTRGIAAATSSVGDLRSAVQGISRDISSVGGLDVGVGGAGTIRALGGDVGGLGRQLVDAGSGGGRAMSQIDSGARGATRSIGETDKAASGLGNSFDSAASSGSRAATQMQRDMGGVSTMTRAATDDMAAFESQFSGSQVTNLGSPANFGAARPSPSEVASHNQWLQSQGAGYKVGTSSTGNTPPGTPPGGRGGRGGSGGSGGDDPFGRAGEGGGFGGGGGPLMMGAMVGGVGELIAGAAGIMGVAEAIKQVPALAQAGSRAMSQFDKSIREAALGATAQGVPALQQLGQSLRPLGTEIGQIGASQMGTVLSAATTLAGTTTQALKNLEPAMGPAIQGLTALAGSVISGVSSPQAVTGIKELAQTLQDPKNEAGIQSLTSGVMTLGTIAGQVLTDTAGAIGNMTGAGGPASMAPTLAAGIGAFMSKGGGPLGALVGGALAYSGAGAAQNAQEQGKDPTNELLAEGAGALLPRMLGMKSPGAALAGGLLGQYGEKGASAAGGGKAAGAVSGALTGANIGSWIGAGIGTLIEPGGGTLIGSRIGAGVGGLIGAGIGYGTGSDSEQTADNAAGVAAPYGWNEDDEGKLTPSKSPTDSGATSAKPQSPFIRAETGGRPISGDSLNAIRDLQGTSGAASRAGVSPTDTPVQPGTTAPSGSDFGRQISPSTLSQLNQGTTGLSTSMSQLNQNTTRAMAPMSQLGNQSMAAASQVSQVPAMVKPTMAALATVAPQATTALGQAASTIASGAESMGTQVPQSMGTGIKANTGAACDAAAELSAGAYKCGATVLKASSPSEKFMELGAGISEGLAIGVKSSAPTAVSAVSQAMASVVSAGAAGLGAASPSKTFQAMGANLMAGAGPAAASGAAPPPGGGRPQPPPGGAGGLAQAQSALAAARAQTAVGAQLRAESDKFNKDAAGPGGSGAHAPDPGGNAMEYSKSIMDRIAGHNKNVEDLKAERAAHQQYAKETLNKQPHVPFQDPRTPPPPGPQKSPGDRVRDWISNQASGPRTPPGTPGAHEGPANFVGGTVDAILGAAGAVGNFVKGQLTTGQRSPVSQSGMDLLNSMAPHQGPQPQRFPQPSIGAPSNQNKQQAEALGAAMPEHMAIGMKKHQGAVGAAASANAGSAITSAKKKLNSASPSGEFRALGLGIGDGLRLGMRDAHRDVERDADDLGHHAHAAIWPWYAALGTGGGTSSGGGGGGGGGGGASAAGGAIGGAVGTGIAGGITHSVPGVANAITGVFAGVNNAAQGVASNAGLAVGYIYAESLRTGVENVIQSSQFQQLGFPQMQSPLAKAALGAKGLLGPAGAGAQSYQLSAKEVSMGAGTPAPQMITIQPQQVILNNDVIATIAQHQVRLSNAALVNSIMRQRSA